MSRLDVSVQRGAVTIKTGHTVILMVVDKFNKMTRFARLKTEATRIGFTVQGSATFLITLATPDSCSTGRTMVLCQRVMLQLGLQLSGVARVVEEVAKPCTIILAAMWVRQESHRHSAMHMPGLMPCATMGNEAHTLLGCSVVLDRR